MTDGRIHRKIYFDTNIFRDAFEGVDEKAFALKSVFSNAKQKPNSIVTSELTLAELLGTEAADKSWAWQTRFYLGLIVSSGFIELRPVTREILLETGDYRRAARQENRSVKLPDAIHVVTSIKAKCKYVFTSDKRMAVPHPLERVAADQDGIEFIRKVLND